MGFIAKAIGSLFGMDDSPAAAPEQPVPAAPAAPAGDTASQKAPANNQVRKKKSGKSSLMADTGSAGSSVGSTGLNL